MKEPIIEVKNLSFEYNKGVNVIKNVSFSIYKGEKVSIIGHNGSGKSTLAKLISYLMEPTDGDIFLFGQKLDEKNINFARKNIGIVFQNPDNQFIGNTVENDIAFGLENRNIEREKMHEIVKEFSKKVGMEDFLNKEPGEISGGQKQRVAIAGILALGLKVIILDEATSMLDPKGVNDINNLINKMRKEDPELTVISITHNIEETVDSDRIIVLNKGEIYLNDKPEIIFNEKEKLEKIQINRPFIYSIKEKFAENNIELKGDDIDSLAREICQLR